MSRTWPIVFGLFALVVAAFWYDANYASARPGAPDVHASDGR